jgi:hypothetical protein
MSTGIPSYLSLSADRAEACAAACACAEAAANFLALSRGLDNPFAIEAQWGAHQAEHLCSKLQRASGPVAKVAGQLAETSVGGVVPFAGIFESCYHVAALEICFRVLNNARLAAGYEPIFPALCRPDSDRTFLTLDSYHSDALDKAMAQGFDKIRSKWRSVRKDLTATFPRFQGAVLSGLIKKEAAQRERPTGSDHVPHGKEPDTAAMRPAKEFLDGKRFRTPKQLTKFLKDHPEIRTQHPRRNRLEIHSGDFMETLSRLGKPAFNALDASPEMVKSFLDEAEATQAEIRTRQSRQ